MFLHKYFRATVLMAVLVMMHFLGQAQAAPSISATDADTLQVDGNGDGKVNRGDTIRHTVTIGNTGDMATSGASFSDTVGSGVTLVPGSIRTTAVAIDDAYSVNEDQLLDVAAPGVLDNDIDPDGDLLTATQVTGPSHGTLLLNANGSFTYTPEGNYNGSDSFTYKVSGSLPASETATVTLTVNSVNDAPAFTLGLAPTVDEDAVAQTMATWATAISNGAPDEETGQAHAQTHTFNITGNTNPGLFAAGPAVSPTGTLTFTPALNAYGVATITLVLQDNGGTADGGIDTSAPQDFVITVNAVNDPPTVVNETFDILGNTELRVDMGVGLTPHTSETTSGPSPLKGVLDNDSDPVENDPVTVTAIGNGCADITAPFDCTLTDGAVVHVETDGAFSYIPKPGATTGGFTYTVTDQPTAGEAANVAGTVTFTVIDMIWYVKPGVSGTGTSASPLGSFVVLNGAGGAGDLDDADDYIFVYSGALTGNIELETGQHLLGEGVGLSIDRNLNGNGTPTNLVAAGTKPVITSTAVPGTVSITRAMPVEVRGLSLASTGGGGNAIDLTAAAALSGAPTLTIADNLFAGATAEGIDVNLFAGTTGTLTLAITGNSWNTAGTHTGNAVDIVRSGGTLRLNLSTNTNITSGAGGVVIDGGAAANTTIIGFSGNSVHGNTVGTGISISNAMFDANTGIAGFQPVAAGTTLVGASGNGVGGSGMVLTSVLGDLNFTDLDIFADGGAGLRASSTGVFNASTGTGLQLVVGNNVGTVEVTGGPALDLSNATVDFRLASLKSTNSSTTGVSLTNVAGTFAAPTGSSITNATSTDFAVSGGNATITYNGTITDDVGQLVSIASTTGGTKSFTGAITDNDDGDGSGISLTSNTGATMTFSGGVTLSTGANTAFNATGGGTVTVTGTTNKLTTTTGTALNVQNTIIGTGGLNFKSISSSGGSSTGIILDNTGSSGSLTVPGTGSAGSGGTIASKTGVDGSTSTGVGIYLNNTKAPSFSWMQINGHQNFGILGYNVTGFTLNDSVINGNNGTSAAGYGEGSIYFGNAATNGVTGAATVSNCDISGGYARNFSVINTAGSLNRLTITNTDFGSTQNVASADDNLSVEARNIGTTVNVTMTGSTIAGAPGDLAEFTGQTGTTMDVVFQNNTLSNSHTYNNTGGGGVTLATQGVMTLNVSNNTMSGAHGSAVTLFKAFNGTSMSGTLDNNDIGTMGSPGSGSQSGNGIDLIFAGVGTVDLDITNNTIYGYNGNAGIYADNTGGTYDVSLTATGNTTGTPGVNAYAGFAMAAGSPTTGDDIDVCADIATNNFSDGDPSNSHDIVLGVSTGSSSMRLVGYSSPNTLIAVENYLTNKNNYAGTVAHAYVDVPATETANFIGVAGACGAPPY